MRSFAVFCPGPDILVADLTTQSDRKKTNKYPTNSTNYGQLHYIQQINSKTHRKNQKAQPLHLLCFYYVTTPAPRERNTAGTCKRPPTNYLEYILYQFNILYSGYGIEYTYFTMPRLCLPPSAFRPYPEHHTRARMQLTQYTYARKKNEGRRRSWTVARQTQIYVPDDTLTLTMPSTPHRNASQHV